MTEELSTKKNLNYLPIAVILAGILIFAADVFHLFGASVKLGMIDEDVNGGDLAFFIIITLAIILIVVVGLLLTIRTFIKKETPGLDTTINVLSIIAVIAFLFVVIMIFLLYMDILGSE